MIHYDYLTQVPIYIIIHKELTEIQEDPLPRSELFALVAAILPIVATIPLCVGMIRKTQHPSKVTWLIWTLLTSVIAAGMYAAGDLSWQMVLIILCDVVIVALAFKYGKSGWTKVDKRTLATTIVIVFLWQMSGEPMVAIGLSLLATFVAGFPMYGALWEEPLSESPFPYSIMLAATVFQLLSLTDWRPTEYVTPVTYLLIQVLILGLLARGWVPRLLRL